MGRLSLAVLSGLLLAGLAVGQQYDHVTVTADSFVTRFWPLSAWLEGNLGLNDTIVTVEAVCASYPGRDRPEKLRNFIRDAYENWGTTHVLLGGDVEIVPCRRAWVDARVVDPILIDSIACDLYFADLDGDWDRDGDGLYGEPEDSCDLYPDVFVSRVPATAAVSAGHIIGKFLAYCSDPGAGYMRNVLLSGFDIFDGVYCETTMELYDSAYVPAGMKPCTRVYDSQPGTHKAAVLAALNAGQHIWLHADHCNYTTMGIGYMNHGQTIDRNELAALTNADHYTIMVSIGCQTGMFNFADCASEYFMLAAGGGGVAAASNSQYGIGSRGNPQRGYVFLLAENFVRGMFTGPQHGSLEGIATAWAAAAPLAHNDIAYRWSLFCWNLLGISAMPVWRPASSWVEERPAPGASNPASIATIAHGVLFLPRGAGHNPIPSGELGLCPKPVLLDASGRHVLELKPGANDVSGLAPGVYFIRGGLNSHSAANRIVVTR